MNIGDYFLNTNVCSFQEAKATKGKFFWTCPNCGAICEKTYRGFAKTPNCYKCSRINTRKSDNEYLIQTKELLTKDYEITGGIKRNENSIVLVEIRHSICGHTTWQRPIAAALNKCGNKDCRAGKIQHSHLTRNEWDIAEANEKRQQTVRKKYEVDNISQLEEIKIKKFETLENSGTKKSCFHSKDEEAIKAFLQDYFETPLKTARILDGQDIDIYIPEKNLGIEYCGIYWHSSSPHARRGHPLAKDYHRKKFESAQSKGIHLIQVFEDEWHNNPELIKIKLLQYGGKNQSSRIHARKCIIKEVSAKDSRQFLIDYHTQGFAAATYRLGAYYNGSLVAVMQFAKNFRNQQDNEKGYELNRFATDIHFRIPGIFSKMLKKASKTYPDIQYLYSYADLRWVNPNSNVYKNNGWELTSESQPDYSYYNVKDKKRYHKSHFQKANIKKNYPDYYNEGETEFEMTDKMSFLLRIYDCGKIKYTYYI